MSRCLRAMEKAGITPDRSPRYSDEELLRRVPELEGAGLRRLRKQYGPGRHASLESQLEWALATVLKTRRGVGPKVIRALARMVSAYLS